MGEVAENKIPQLRERIAESERRSAKKDKFIAAIRRFMQMDKLTAPLLRELIDRIEVYETQGVDKNRTQKIVIHYRFVGYIDIQEAPLKEHYVAETRQGGCCGSTSWHKKEQVPALLKDEA